MTFVYSWVNLLKKMEWKWNSQSHTRSQIFGSFSNEMDLLSKVKVRSGVVELK